ncbi:MAG: type II secretion system F family protein [Candidatus Sericytochromatia bacterium]
MLLTLTLGTAFLAAASATWAIAPRRDPLDARMARYMAGPGVPASRPASAPRGPSPQVRLPRAWEAFLARGGREWSAPPARGGVAGYAGLGAAAGAWVAMPALGALAGVLALYLRLRARQARRIHLMAEQLPDALMLMVSALKSGLGMQQALHWVAAEGSAPLAPEFGRLSSDMALGLSLEEALVRLQTRLGSVDGEMLAAALLVQRQTGGNLSEVLLNLHQTVRDRQAVQGQVRTLTAQGKMTGVILTALPFAVALGLYAFNRPYLMVLLTDPRGQTALTACGVMMAVAAVWIRRVSHIAL